MTKALYICYFGIREPLVQTQVIPYLREIIKGGTEMSLLTFEPDRKNTWTPAEIEKERLALAEMGIKWHSLAYHKRPSAPATAWDVLAGTRYVRRLLARERFDILHCRVHIPMLIGALARKASGRKPKLLFDIRGFFPEEYTDAGIWPENGVIYRTVKQIERWLMREADGFVVLTEKARDILFPECADAPTAEGCRDRLGRPVEVIPCCVDLDRFRGVNGATRKEWRQKLGLDGRRVIAYVGSFGGWYMTRETADLFAAAKKRDASAFALILSQSPAGLIEPLLRERGFSTDDYLIKRVPSRELPLYLSTADAGVSLIKPCFSKQSSSPTKNAEYLASGLPIIANAGVGDVDEMISRSGTGVLLNGFGQNDLETALDALEKLGDVGGLCRETARNEFDLQQVGGERYRRIYRRLADPEEGPIS